MKYFKIFVLIFALSITLAGCRQEESQPTPTTPETNGADTGDITLDLPQAGDADRVVTGGASQDGIDKQVTDKNSFVNLGDYKNIKMIDVSDWEEYIDTFFNFSIFYPSDYVVIEETLGYFILTGEGPGNFFRMTVDAEDPFIPDAKLLKTHEVGINGIDFTVEEYDTMQGFNMLSYKTEHNGMEYRITYNFVEGLEDFVDLFNRSAQTFKFLE